MTPLLELRDIVVRTRTRTILDIPHLTLDADETLALVGVNGAGKSTLLRVASGLRSVDEGSILLDGKPTTEQAIRGTTAAVLQRPLLRRGSTRSNVETGLRFHGASREEARRLAAPWLKRLGIAELADAPAHHLSGGEAQRVSLARALAIAPRLLLLDEPFSPLDAPTRVELLEDLRSILAETETAAIFATHDVREAQALADRVAVLHEGQVRQLGPAAQVLANPADETCAHVLGTRKAGFTSPSRLPQR
jgi:ABC-type nitrate/sulfonate/bicarbonate transport system ATPase subunit